jgi:single-strand DNA-binding protein
MSPSINVVVLLGRLLRPAEERLLPSGGRVLQLEVAVQRAEEKAESVPVVWYDAPARATTLDVDEQVVVTGRVRRRFFRSGGATQSRTEVVADEVVPSRQGRKVSAALDRAWAVIRERGAA